jgi:predicted Rossmann fold nucleotide-binding protein DprA/Smf involved in DNA uptake
VQISYKTYDPIESEKKKNKEREKRRRKVKKQEKRKKIDKTMNGERKRGIKFIEISDNNYFAEILKSFDARWKCMIF